MPTIATFLGRSSFRQFNPASSQNTEVWVPQNNDGESSPKQKKINLYAHKHFDLRASTQSLGRRHIEVHFSVVGM